MKRSQWQPIESAPNNIFDVFAKRWVPHTDSFTMHRFAGCVMVDGVIMWDSPFHEQPVALSSLGFRATHWMHIPVVPGEMVP